MENQNKLDANGIKSVTSYTACPVECCDRCSQGIKYVFAVTYKDGLVQRYGMECIKHILENAPSLRTLFTKNAKLLQRYNEYISILTGPVDQMPRGREYFNSGLYFIADRSGKDISFHQWFFHPIYDVEKNQSGTAYVQKCSPAERAAECTKEIEKTVPKIKAEIARLEAFLAKVMRLAAREKTVL